MTTEKKLLEMTGQELHSLIYDAMRLALDDHRENQDTIIRQNADVTWSYPARMSYRSQKAFAATMRSKSDTPSAEEEGR